MYSEIDYNNDSTILEVLELYDEFIWDDSKVVVLPGGRRQVR